MKITIEFPTPKDTGSLIAVVNAVDQFRMAVPHAKVTIEPGDDDKARARPTFENTPFGFEAPDDTELPQRARKMWF